MVFTYPSLIKYKPVYYRLDWVKPASFLSCGWSYAILSTQIIRKSTELRGLLWPASPAAQPHLLKPGFDQRHNVGRIVGEQDRPVGIWRKPFVKQHQRQPLFL